MKNITRGESLPWAGSIQLLHVVKDLLELPCLRVCLRLGKSALLEDGVKFFLGATVFCCKFLCELFAAVCVIVTCVCGDLQTSLDLLNFSLDQGNLGIAATGSTGTSLRIPSIGAAVEAGGIVVIKRICAVTREARSFATSSSELLDIAPSP